MQAQNPGNPMRDVPMQLNVENLSEEWGVDNQGRLPDNWTPAPPGSIFERTQVSHEDYLNDLDRKAADIHGAGFSWQDRTRDLIADPELKRDVSIINALMKTAYMSGIVDKFSKKTVPGGDIGGMEKTSGNKYVRELLAASILGDLYAAGKPESPASLSFTTAGGAPGLLFNYRF